MVFYEKINNFQQNNFTSCTTFVLNRNYKNRVDKNIKLIKNSGKCPSSFSFGQTATNRFLGC